MTQNATNGYGKILGDQLRKDPTLLVSFAHDGRENVLRRKAAYPGVWNKISLRNFLELKSFIISAGTYK